MQTHYPKPTNSEKFEDLCLDLWRLEWNDPKAHKYSSNPRGQKGIDIHGHPNQGSDRHAVQCKANTISNKLDLKIVNADIKKAKHLKPAIKELIFATTADRDPDNQDFIAEAHAKSVKEGSFRIFLYSWDEIEELLDKYPPVALKHFPEQCLRLVDASFEVWQKSSSGSLSSQESAWCSPTINFIQSKITNLIDKNAEANNSSKSASLLDKVRDFLNASKLDEAQQKLNSFEDVFLSNASKQERFRYYYYKGDIYNETFDFTKASLNYSLAYDSDPAHSSANGVKALSHLMNGELEAAGRLAEQSIIENACDELPYQILVQVYPEKSIEEIIAPIAVENRSQTKMSFVIGEVARRKGNYKLALEWLEKAYNQEPENIKVAAAYCNCLYEDLYGNLQLPTFGLLTAELKAQVDRAIELTNDIMLKVRGDRLQSTARAFLVANKANAYRLLNMKADAEKTFNEYNQIGDPENAQVLQIRALTALQFDDYQEAENLIKQVILKWPADINKLILAEVLKLQHKNSEALELFDNERLFDSIECHEDSNRLYIHLLHSLGRSHDAIEHADNLFQSSSQSIWLIHKALIECSLKDKDKACTTLQQAEVQLPENPTDKDYLEIGMAFYELQDFKSAAGYLRKLGIDWGNNVATRILIKSYYFSGDKSKALKICQAIRNRLGIIDFAAQMELSLYIEVYDYPKAVELYDLIIALQPNLIELKIDRAILNFQLQNYDLVDSFLKEHIDLRGMTNLNAWLNLVFLYKERNMLERALETIYELRREHADNKWAHIKYVALFLEQELAISKIGHIDSMAIIQVDSMIKVRRPDGTSACYIIENRVDANLNAGEIRPDNSIAAALMQRSVGDTTPSGIYIEEVMHKYRYAFRQTLEEFDFNFPESKEIEKVNIPINPKKTTIFEDLNPLLARVDSYVSRNQDILKLYKNEPLTIGFISKVFDENPINTWARLQQQIDTNIYAAFGTEQERSVALELLKKEGATLVLDITALLTIHALDIAHLVKEYYEKIAVCWTTLEHLTQYTLESRSALQKGYLTISKENDSYIRYEVPPEVVQKNCAFIEGIENWVREHCQILPVYGLFDEVKASDVSERIGASFYHTLLLARQQNCILYTDDARLRFLAQHTDCSTGVWIQPILTDLFLNKMNDPAQYALHIVELIKLNYNYVSVDKNVLFYLLKLNDWTVNESFGMALNVLLSPETTWSSTVTVLVHFVRTLWEEVPYSEKRDRIFREVLEKFYINIKSNNSSKVLNHLQVKVPNLDFAAKELSFRLVGYSLWALGHALYECFVRFNLNKSQMISIFEDFVNTHVDIQDVRVFLNLENSHENRVRLDKPYQLAKSINI